MKRSAGVTAMPDAAGLDRLVRSFVEALAADDADDLLKARWVHRLGERVRLERFEKGDVLVRHHAVTDGVRFLIDGRVRYEPLVTDDAERETIAARQVPWMAVGWSSLDFRRHRVTVVADSDGHLLTLPLAAWQELSRDAPTLWAHVADLTLRTSTRLLWEARGRRPPPPGSMPTAGVDLPAVPTTGPGSLDEMLEHGCFSVLPEACRRWLAEHSEIRWAPAGACIIEEGAASDGLWFLHGGRVALTATVTGDHKPQTTVLHAVRPGSLLCWSSFVAPLPAPYGVEAKRDTTVAYVPRSALVELLRRHPAWAGSVCTQQLQELRRCLVATRIHRRGRAPDGGVGAFSRLVQDSKPVLPANSEMYGLPHLLRSHLTHRDGFERLYRAYFTGARSERAVASVSLDLLRDLERAHRWFAGLQATYAAVVRHQHLEAAELRRLSSQHFRDALSHMPYVIKGWEHLPDDPNCIVIYNHMAYAEESILPNGFLFNPDSHFVSSIILEQRYGDGIRVSRENADTEFWRADYYGRLGHIDVTTPESGWRGETPEEKQLRKDRFFADCAAVLAGGQPFAIAPEGTITAEDSSTERSPGPLRAGAFLMSAKLPSRPSIVPVALANFDKPPHEAVFSCVIQPAFTMESRGVDVDDRGAMNGFLESYRREFRGHVEEAVDVARTVREPGTDLSGLITNLDRVDHVSAAFEHDVRALEHPVQRVSTGGATTVFYGSSTIREWETFAEDIGLSDAVNLGFGGSTLGACRAYFDRLVVRYEPSRLVVYGGDNDIDAGASPEVVSKEFRALADQVRTVLPTTRCWFISIKPSPARREHLSLIQRTNALIRAEVERRDQWHFVDWFRYMLDEHGQPNAQLFEWDQLHVNLAGYGILAHLLRRELGTAR